MIGRRRKRVRVHLFEQGAPSIEGLLLAHHNGEFRVGVPTLLMAAGAKPAVLDDARELAIPTPNVMFYEVLR